MIEKQIFENYLDCYKIYHFVKREKYLSIALEYIS